jgi:hypothetical protein
MTIHIRTIDQLSHLTSKLTADPRFAFLVARYTRGVLVDHSIDILSRPRMERSAATSFAAGLLSLLQVVKHLDTLVCRTLYATKALSSIIAPASCPISTEPFLLQVLEIQLQNLGSSMLRQLGQFVGLQQLRLFIPDDMDVLDPVPVDHDLVEHTPTWSMPLLHSIWWHSDAAIDRRDAAFFHFLTRSSLPALCALNLSLYPLTAATVDAASCFFAKYAHLQTVELDSRRWGLADLVPLVMSPQLLIDTVDVECLSGPIVDFTTTFNRELKELILLARYGSEAADGVLEFVCAIGKVIEEQPWIESVVVRYRPDAAYIPLALGEVPLKERLAAIVEDWSARNIVTKLRDELLDDSPISQVAV